MKKNLIWKNLKHKNTIKIAWMFKNFTKNLILLELETLCSLLVIIRCFFKVKKIPWIFLVRNSIFFLVPHEELKTEENTTCTTIFHREAKEGSQGQMNSIINQLVHSSLYSTLFSSFVKMIHKDTSIYIFK